MNRRAAAVLAAMTAGVLAIAVVTVGGSLGHFGFGDDEGGAQPAAAQEQSTVPADEATTATEQDDDHDEYEEYGDDGSSGWSSRAEPSGSDP